MMTEPPAELGFKYRFVPGSTTPPTRALLLLHGTGGDEDDLIPFGSMLAPGAALLSPRGKVLENGMPRFFRRLAEGVFDIEDLKLRTAELAEFIAKAKAEYGLTDTELIAFGFSNGANIASSLLLRFPDRLRGVILARPMVPFTPSEPPDLDGKRVLILAGLRDTTVPASQTTELAAMFRAGGAEVKVSMLEAGHGLVQQDIQAARKWLATGAKK
jgi:phospholipase/carboxylesterase